MLLYKRITVIVLSLVVNFKTISGQQKLTIVLSEAKPPKAIRHVS